jgi:cytochrome c biogenesis protein CcmG/thiol:disulfide interchange protein DsbE
MMKPQRYRVAARIGMLILAALLMGCGASEETTPSASGYDFTLRDLEGREVNFSDYGGKVVMVNFWAPWCGPCRMETPDLIDLFTEYRDRGFEILAVAIAFRGEQSVHDFVQESGVPYPVLFGNDNLVKQYGGFRGIPTTFLFTRDGKLYRKYEGMRPRSVFEEDIKELLQKR